MDFVLEFIEQYGPSPRVMYYLMIVYAVFVIALSVAWGVSLFLEVTKKRASKLSVKFGNADAQENKVKVGKLVIQGILLVMAWVFFVLVF